MVGPFVSSKRQNILTLAARTIESRAARLNDPSDAAGFGNVAIASGALFALAVIDGETMLEISELPIVMHEVA